MKTLTIHNDKIKIDGKNYYSYLQLSEEFGIRKSLLESCYNRNREIFEIHTVLLEGEPLKKIFNRLHLETGIYRSYMGKLRIFSEESLSLFANYIQGKLNSVPKKRKSRGDISIALDEEDEIEDIIHTEVGDLEPKNDFQLNMSDRELLISIYLMLLGLAKG